ncbi:glycosyltransferase, partial [Escherichia coli]
MNERANVVAIVVTFKRKEFLCKILDSLIRQTFPINKIIVIDNNSLDGTKELVEDFCRINTEVNRKIKYYDTGENLGGAGGFKCGFEIARNFDYSHLWLMDDDLLPEDNCLEILLKCNIEGIVQPIRMNMDGTCAELSPINYDLKNPFRLRAKTKTVADIYIKDKTPYLFDIHSVPFEGPLITKSVVEKIGFPNEKFFIFNDDLDYSLRARQKKFRICCSSQAKATRLLKNNIKNDLSSWKGYYMLRNYFYIMRKYGDNFMVRLKPHWAIWIFIFYFFLTGKKNINRIFSAYLDSKELTNSKK